MNEKGKKKKTPNDSMIKVYTGEMLTREIFKSRLNLIVWVNVGLLLLTVTDVSTTCAVVIFRVKVSCITSDDDNVVA